MPAVIFDLDGTLMDSYDAHFESWCHLAGELGHELTEAQFQQQFGRKNEPILAELHEWTGAALPDDAEIDRLAQRKEARYRETIGKDFPVMRGAVELIAMLKARHWQVAIGSSTPRVNLEFTQARLAKRGVHFDAVACGCDVTRSKPEPDVFLLAAERLGVRPRDCVVIEDAPAGIEAAHRAGMASVGLASKGRTREELAQALCVVDCLTELGVDVLDGLARART